MWEFLSFTSMPGICTTTKFSLTKSPSMLWAIVQLIPFIWSLMMWVQLWLTQSTLRSLIFGESIRSQDLSLRLMPTSFKISRSTSPQDLKRFQTTAGKVVNSPVIGLIMSGKSTRRLWSLHPITPCFSVWIQQQVYLRCLSSIRLTDLTKFTYQHQMDTHGVTPAAKAGFLKLPS